MRGKRRLRRSGTQLRRGMVSAGIAAAMALSSAWVSGAVAQVPGGTAGPADTLTLADALAVALERDPQLMAASAGADAAAAGRVQARAAWLPSLVSSGTVTRFQEPMVVAPLHRFDPNSPPAFARTLAQGRLTLDWTVFDGGARRARIDAAGARVTAADAGAAAAHADAVLAVIEAYLRVLGARDALAAQRTRETELEEERGRAERFVAEGAAPRLELLRAEAELEAVRAQGVGTGAAQSVAEAELARLLGRSAERVARATLVDVRPAASAPPTAFGRATDHPLLLEARGRVAASEALLREARSAWLPACEGRACWSNTEAEAAASQRNGRPGSRWTTRSSPGVHAAHAWTRRGPKRAAPPPKGKPSRTRWNA